VSKNPSDVAPDIRLVALVLIGAAATVISFVTPILVVKLLIPDTFSERPPSWALITLLLVGVTAGQFGLLAIWGVFGALHWAVRLPLMLLIAAWLFAIFLFGMAAADLSAGVVGVYARNLLLLPLMFAGVQLPLWIARVVLGWRLVFGPHAAEPEPSRAGQFGLQHLLGATTAVAVVLAFTQTAVLLVSSPHNRPAQVWTSLLISCAVLAALGLLAALPCVWAAFVARRRGLATAIVAGYTVVCAILAPFVIVLGGGWLDPDHFLASFWLHAGAMSTMLGGLHVVRACGYTMLRRGRPAPGDRARV